MRYRFRPNFAATVAVLVVIPAFVWLGFWQLRRADEAIALQAQYDRKSQVAPVPVAATPQPVGALQYYRVVAKGYYEPQHQILVDNRIYQGQVGYYVVTPLRVAGGRARVLVNRGWIPLGIDREHLPNVATPTGLQTVTGVATVPPQDVFTLAKPPALDRGWQPVWEYLDMDRYRRAVPYPLQPVTILLDPTSDAGGFVRVWRRHDTRVAMHQGYALQWFTMAAAVAVLYLWYSVRRREQG